MVLGRMHRNDNNFNVRVHGNMYIAYAMPTHTVINIIGRITRECEVSDLECLCSFKRFFIESGEK